MEAAEEKPKLIAWDARELYKNRLILYLENDPLSNKYRQVILTETQFKTIVSFLNQMFTSIPNPVDAGMRSTVMIVSKDQVINLPDKVQEFYHMTKS